jgi:glucose-6-phosphate isomerase
MKPFNASTHWSSFDQPNVESAKKATKEMLQKYEHTGKLPGAKARQSINRK